MRIMLANISIRSELTYWFGDSSREKRSDLVVMIILELIKLILSLSFLLIILQEVSAR